MPVMTVLILANSVRHWPNACVAGREVIEQAGQRGFGAWVRPVSAHGEGELSLHERSTSLGREVRVLDIVRMPLREPVPDDLQPENWRHGGAPPWDVIGQGTVEDLKCASETPTSLWDELGDRPDRIAEERAKQSPLTQSLLLLALEGLAIELSSEHYPERTRKQRRALFRYRNRNYSLSITDPTIEARYGLQVPTPSEPALTHRIGHQCFVCISLAHQPFHGHHYKLAAAIIDPEHL